MKNVFLLFLVLLVTCKLSAQRAFVETIPFAVNNTPSKNLTSVDTTKTLGYAAYMRATQALYRDQFGGYAVGTNFFGDIAKAQEYTVNGRKNISKVLFYFAAKKKVAPDSISYLTVNIYSIKDTGYASGSVYKTCPSAILHSRKLYLDSIDTIAGHLTTVNFDWALSDSLSNNFAVGFDMSTLDTADRVGLYSTKDSSANKSQRSWEKQNNKKWYTMLRSWPLDIDFAIFPVVDTTLVGIHKLTSNPENQFNISPNPANEKALINYSITNQESLSFRVFDNLGNLIINQSLANPAKGKHSFEFQTNSLKAGIYFCQLQSESSFTYQKLVITH